MKTLDFVLTDKISIAGKAEDFTAKQVPLVAPDAKTTVYNLSLVASHFLWALMKRLC